MLETVPEIKEVVGDAYGDQIVTFNNHNGEVKEEQVLQSVFTKLMSVDHDVISKALSRLINSLNIEKQVPSPKHPLHLQDLHNHRSVSKKNAHEIGIVSSALNKKRK
uniref:Mannose-6-phosphate isomerase 2-like n=1 Tax=Tanacetum cinerariifolium TaxID=118510 RepID=A0A6L2KIP7_TANCI|nr:mannose-6-phosphate isomerase 2-like [Tanacetum cinerariifolium]